MKLGPSRRAVQTWKQFIQLAFHRYSSPHCLSLVSEVWTAGARKPADTGMAAMASKRKTPRGVSSTRSLCPENWIGSNELPMELRLPPKSATFKARVLGKVSLFHRHFPLIKLLWTLWRTSECNLFALKKANPIPVPFRTVEVTFL